MKDRKIETEFNQHFIDGYKNTESIGSQYKDLKHERVIIVGIGGSSLGGLLLKTLINEDENNIDIFIHKTYGLPPKSIYKNALIVVISYAGNTEEILDSYDEAIKKRLPVVVITSGGKLKEKATKNKVPTFFLPEGYKPRFSLVYQLGALISILENSKIIKSQDKIIKTLKSNDFTKIEKKADKLIDYIGDDIPLFYASPKYASLSHIIKIQINENAKMHCFSNVFPETGHNEIMGYTNTTHSKKYKAVILQPKDDDIRILNQQNIFANILKQHNNPIRKVDITGETTYNTLFQGILLGHILSFKLAKKHGVDPYATDVH